MEDVNIHNIKADDQISILFGVLSYSQQNKKITELAL